jgi:hypothetical protein
VRRPFLTARWTDLVILNYEVPPAAVLPLVPRGTELDLWQSQAAVLPNGSEAEFITEHYWGYARQRDGGTSEYEVEHPRWRVWTTPRTTFDGLAA